VAALSSRDAHETRARAHTEREINRRRAEEKHHQRDGYGGGRRGLSFVFPSLSVCSLVLGKKNHTTQILGFHSSFDPQHRLFSSTKEIKENDDDVDDDEMEDEEEDDDENTNTNFSLYERLKRAWFDEQNAPILLKFKSNLVERFSNLISSREAEIDMAEKEANESGDGTEMLLMSIAREELNRAKYVLRSYLRARIKKLQQFPAHYLQKRGEEEEDSNNTASEKEETFAEGLVEAYDKHAKSILSNFPSEYGDALIEFNRGGGDGENDEKPEMTMVSRPDEKNAMVFVRMLEDVGEFTFQNGEDGEDRVFDLRKGTIYWCKFDQFKGLLESSSGGELEEEEEDGGGGGGERPRAELL